MAGNSELEDNLVDDLVPIIDDLRADLYQSMGSRQYEVHLVRRHWDGAERGDGAATITQDEVIAPPPNFTDLTKYQISPIGRMDEGDARLTEVSLTYTEDELSGGVIPPADEFYYRIVDLRGQGIRPKYYVPSGTPTTDRDRNIGWVVSLNNVVVQE